MLEPVLFAGAVHVEILPEPLVNRPIAAFVLAQLNEAPVILGTKFPILIGEPGQTVISAI